MADLVPYDLLVSVATLGSMGRAAVAHGVSQAAVSARIRSLESALGLTLLERSISEASLYEDQYCLADLVWLKAECQHALGQPAQALFEEARSLANQSGSLGLLQRYAGRRPPSV